MIAHAVMMIVGTVMVVVAVADLVNTLVTTSSSRSSHVNMWPSRIVARHAFLGLRSIVARIGEHRPARERLLATFGPLLLLNLLTMWVTLQVVGFGLIWAGMRGIKGTTSVFGHVYYSGVSFFTIGFGDVVPTDVLPRAGVLVEGLLGVVTTALVIAYLPMLYAAYATRERPLSTLDDGSAGPVTPNSLLFAWSPDANPQLIDAKFADWESWAVDIAASHGASPMLRFFRSYDRQHNWLTALKLLTEAAMRAQLIVGASNGSSFWFLRRADTIFQLMAQGANLDPWREKVRLTDEQHERQVREMYDQLSAHGFELVPFEVALTEVANIREMYAPTVAYVAHWLLSPPEFWPPQTVIQRVPPA